MEVPKIEYVDKVVEDVVVTKIQKFVEVPEIRYIDKVVDVPKIIIVEKVIEIARSEHIDVNVDTVYEDVDLGTTQQHAPVGF